MIERTFSVSRLSCQFCVGKNHCGRCSRECPVDCIRLAEREVPA